MDESNIRFKDFDHDEIYGPLCLTCGKKHEVAPDSNNPIEKIGLCSECQKLLKETIRDGYRQVGWL